MAGRFPAETAQILKWKICAVMGNHKIPILFKGGFKCKMRVAIYIRVSTLDQAEDGYSLAAQERILREYCDGRGYIVTQVYADKGISGKDIRHRPAMQQIIEDGSNKLFDAILVWALSRFTRSVSDLYVTHGNFKKRNIKLISYTEGFDADTPTGRALMGMLGVFAQMEREQTGERVSIAMEERAIQGKRTCHEVLGYDIQGSDNLIINPIEAGRVRFIFNSYSTCRNYSEVARQCDKKHYRGKRGRIFKAEHIKCILTRPIYAGHNSFKGKIYKGSHDPIIPLADFNYIQKMIGKSPIAM